MNIGHRLGEKTIKGRENTITRLNANWKHQPESKFKYWEFDINETLDGKVVVHHDRDFGLKGDKDLIRKMTLAEIRQQFPFVPTLRQVLNRIKKLNETSDIKSKPVRCEIKRLVSDKGRYSAIYLMEKFREETGIDTQFIAFKSHFKKSFPKKVRVTWAKRYKMHNFKVLNIRSKKKNLFKT